MAASDGGAGPSEARPRGRHRRSPEGAARQKARKRARRNAPPLAQTDEALRRQLASCEAELAKQKQLTALARKQRERDARVSFAHGVQAERINNKRVRAAKKEKRAGRNRQQAARRYNDRARAASM